MKIPSFVPLVESERRKREIVGLILQVLTWGYSTVVFVRVLIWGMVLPFIENLSFSEPPVAWAEKTIKALNYDSRYLDFAWSTLGWLFLAGCAIGLFIGLTGRGFGAWVASISKLQVNNPEDSLRISNHWRYARKEGLALLALTFAAGWVITKIDLAKLFETDGLQGAGRLLLQLSCGIPGVGAQSLTFGSLHAMDFGGSLFDVVQWVLNGAVSVINAGGRLFNWAEMPSFSLNCIPSDADYYGVALTKLAESIYLAFMATFFAVPVAFLLAFFAARNLTRYSVFTRFLYGLVRIYINITRSIEPLIWAILFSVWIGIGPFAGSIALMIHSISSLVKQYSEAIESVDEGPLEALQATGANRVATAWFAVVPQVLLPYLAFTIYRWDINVRMATIIGLVGGGGIGGLLIQEQGLAHWTQVGTIAFLIFIVVWGMDFLSARVREAIQ